MYRTLMRRRILLSALTLSVIVFLLQIWWGTLSLLFRVLSDTSIPFESAVTLTGSLLTASFLDLNLGDTLYILVSSLLIGINGALILHLIHRNRRLSPSAASSGVLGAFAALIGTGCAACGNVIFFSLFGTTLGTYLTHMPLGGAEIAYSGIVLLFLSSALLTRAIVRPATCPT